MCDLEMCCLQKMIMYILIMCTKIIKYPYVECQSKMQKNLSSIKFAL